MTLLLAHIEDVLAKLVHLLLSDFMHLFLQIKIVCLHLKLQIKLAHLFIVKLSIFLNFL